MRKFAMALALASARSNSASRQTLNDPLLVVTAYIEGLSQPTAIRF